MNVRVKFGDSTSKSSRDIRGADFVLKNELIEANHIGQKRLPDVSPKKLTLLVCNGKGLIL